MDKNLRLLAGSIIVESKLSRSAKQQLLNFIKEEASDVQIKVLLMDGKITQLDKDAENIANERFKNSKFSKNISTFDVRQYLKK